MSKDRVEVKVMVRNTLVKALEAFCEFHGLDMDEVLTDIVEDCIVSLMTQWDDTRA